MGNLIKMLVVLLVMFSLSAGASWYVSSLYAPKEGSHADEHEKEAKKGPSKAGKTDAAQLENNASFRAAFSPEADAWAGLSANLKAREENIERQKEIIGVRLKTFDLISQDWRVERAVTEDLQKKVEAETRALADKIAVLERTKEEVKGQRKDTDERLTELNKKLLEIDGVEAARMPQIASTFDSMNPDAAAKTLKGMVEKGNTDFAVKILSAMKQRAAANVLNSMPETMTQELMDRLKSLQQPAKKE